MRLLLVAVASLFASSSTAAPVPAAPPPAGNPPGASGTAALPGRNCISPNLHHAKPGAPAQMRRLDELPPGATVLAVMRNFDGCQELVIANYGVGSTLRNEGTQPLRPALRR